MHLVHAERVPQREVWTRAQSGRLDRTHEKTFARSVDTEIDQGEEYRSTCFGSPPQVIIVRDSLLSSSNSKLSL